jgi:hypothetical protein
MKPLYFAISLLALTACSLSDKTQPSQPSTTADLVEETIDDDFYYPDDDTTAASPRSTNSFTTQQEAYDEGYAKGQQEGYDDASNHLRYSDINDDQSPCEGFAEAYSRGYADGYHDGYIQGLASDSDDEDFEPTGSSSSHGIYIPPSRR